MPCYGLDGLEVKFNVGEIFSARPDRPRGPFNLLCNRCLILPRVKALGGGGVALTTQPLLTPMLLYPRLPCVPAQACHGVTFPFYAASTSRTEAFIRNIPI